MYDIKEVYEKHPKLMDPFIIPLFYRDAEENNPCGTAFIVEKNNICYMVSAEHVFRPLLEGRELFYYMAGLRPEGVPIVELKAASILVNEIYDVGVSVLPADLSPPYKEIGKYAVSYNSLLFLENFHSDNVYSVNGFPNTYKRFSRKEKLIQSKAYHYFSNPVSELEYEKLKIEMSDFVLLSFDKYNCHNTEGKGVVSADPFGVSGGPICLVCEGKVYDPKRIAVVGVITDWKKEGKLFQGSNIRHVIDLINKL